MVEKAQRRLRRLPHFRFPFFLMLTLLTMQNLILPHVDTSDYAEPRFLGPCCKWKSFFGKINGRAELVPRVSRVWRGVAWRGVAGRNLAFCSGHKLEWNNNKKSMIFHSPRNKSFLINKL
jgi:hypothetical protein